MATKTFTARSNARRAAKRMIATGEAPGSDFSLQTDDAGLTSIVWNSAPAEEPAVMPAPETAAIETEIAAASAAAERPAPEQPEPPAEKPKRTNRTAKEPSRATELDEAAAKGIMPEKPVITSATNQHYQKHLDRLAELAAADDWNAIGAYEVKGSNTYAKLVARYRARLLTAHDAGEPA